MPSLSPTPPLRPDPARSGAALILALWVLILLSLLIGSFAFDMHIEAGVSSFYRKRLKAQYLARGGIELAKATLVRSLFEPSTEEPDEADELGMAAERLIHGARTELSRTLGNGEVKVTIHPAEAKRNVNMLSDEEWKDIFDEANIPKDMWLDLIDCFFDWTDPNDDHRFNGAEEDDPFYEEREYFPKNGALDTIDELLLIKNFEPSIVLGGTLGKEETPIKGIGHVLTTWSTGKINPNAADERTLATLGLDDWEIEAIMAHRRGDDGIDGTPDDNVFETQNDILSVVPGAETLLTVQDIRFVRVDSIGQVGQDHPVRVGISCMMRVSEETAIPVFWHEGILP